MNEFERMAKMIGAEITMEKECTIEHEKGCGYIQVHSWSEVAVVFYLEEQGFTDIDRNCMDIDENGFGYIWVC